MNNEDVLELSGADAPSASEKLDGGGGADFAREVESQVQIQQRFRRRGLELGAFFLERFIPGLAGNQAGGAMAVGGIVASNFLLQQLIGLWVVLDLFIGKEGDQALLQGAKEPLDFAFGLRGRSHAMIDTQATQGALELAQGVQAVGGGGVAKKAQTIGIEIRGTTAAFQAGPQVAEVVPGGIGVEAAGDNFAGVIIRGENEILQSRAGPPLVGRGIVLPEFTNGGGFPAAAGFRAWRAVENELWKMFLKELAERGAGAAEAKTALQLLSQESIIERSGQGNNFAQE